MGLYNRERKRELKDGEKDREQVGQIRDGGMKKSYNKARKKRQGGKENKIEKKVRKTHF